MNTNLKINIVEITYRFYQLHWKIEQTHQIFSRNTIENSKNYVNAISIVNK